MNVKEWTLVFDDVMISQLKKVASNNQAKQILSKMLDKIELLGPMAGKLLDSKLHIYEIKNMRPPIRLYFKIAEPAKEAYIFEYEMKTSKEKQARTVQRIKSKSQISPAKSFSL